MLFKDIPIRRKLMRVILLIIGVVLLVTCLTFFMYELYSFRSTTRQNLSTLGKIIATNSTAALAFDDQVAAKEILAALRAEPHIEAAALYDRSGHLFAQYASRPGADTLPAGPGSQGYQYRHSQLEGFQPVFQESRRLGTLYLRSDLGAIYDRFRVYGLMVAMVVILSFLLAYGLSKILQKSVSYPILALAGTAKSISERKDYSMRAVKAGRDELGSLTDAFNDMLGQIQMQNRTLNEFNHSLEYKVRDRTAELEALNRELEAFSYSISHDLRAPLRAIIGFVSILEEDYSGKLDDEARRITGIIKNNTMKMGHLIDGLLAFSRMGRQEINMTNIDMAAMVREVLEEIDQDDKHSRIRWNVGEIPPARGDIHAIRQVWMNLISNAVKYSSKREEPRVEIGSYAREGEICFFVKDNGAGFDEKYKHKLFKVFQRLHKSDDFEGTGVGLAIVEKILSKHGGKAWAEASLHNGACFYFSLPDKQK